ncbi:hypothetical protein BDM02DRAFT_1526754 [Thelephora ganbajun]|uniref:Uncharacterized protein n=1 Tax=Thelephora ganbajun TaxID=370292 RepID=A0ACB6ZL32_THEGA|nr:hypothetical protein BDM02DRAFT_1526754 [Thelephora ganbajun]
MVCKALPDTPSAAPRWSARCTANRKAPDIKPRETTPDTSTQVTTLIHSTMQSERYPLPFGWIKEFDQTSGRSFYVDTKANPPRSIWTHPYEDEEYLKAHPDVREKLDTGRFGGSDSNLLPPSFEESQRRHSSSSSQPQATTTSTAGSSGRKHRGPLGMLKDQVFGSKEERKAEKKRKEEDRARKEAQRQHIQQTNMARQQFYADQPHYSYGPATGAVPYGSGYGSHNRRPGGGIGLGLPLLGGLAGGLLLGELLDNDFGGYGGGGFGGFDGGFGDFGGGF